MNIKLTKHCLSTALLVLFALISNAQNQNAISDFYPPSSNAASLGVFAKQSINMHVGAPSVSIPLYTVTEGPLSVPITLGYNSTGVKVNERTSWVGMNWALDAGGVITREVKDLPDESITVGFFQNASQPADLVHDANITVNDLDRLYNGYDLEADIFYFNFGGYSGRFFSTNNSVDIDNAEFATVPHLNFKIEYVKDNASDVIIEFTITDANGVKYIFGDANVSYVPQSFRYGPVEFTKAVNSTQGVSTVAWYLREIISPVNLQKITFHYKSVDDNGKEYLAVDHKEVTTSSYSGATFPMSTPEEEGPIGSFFRKFFPKIHDFLALQAQYFFNGETPYDINTVTYRRFLESIETSSELITFNSSDNGFLLYMPPNIADFESGGYNVRDQKLDEIVVKNTQLNKEKMRIGLCYDDPRFRLTLRDVNITAGDETNTYKLTYQDQYDLPVKITKKIDHWNYFNGEPANYNLCDDGSSYLSPLLYKNEDTGEEVYQSTSRDINLNRTGIGMLTKIEYPTGGSTSFEYEQNQYNVYFYRKKGYHDVQNGYSNLKPVILSQNAYCGGVRVSKTIEDNGNGDQIEKSYTYEGGTLSEMPVYHYSATGGIFGVSNAVFEFQVSSSNPLNRFGSTFGSSVGYSKVTEILEDGSSIETTFSNFMDYSDVVEGYTNDIRYFFREDGIERILGVELPANAPVTSLEFKRGLKQSVNFKNSSGENVKSVNYQYAEIIPDGRDSRTVFNLCRSNNYSGSVEIPSTSDDDDASSYSVSSRSITPYRVYFYPYVLKQEKITEKLNGKDMVSIINYDYSQDQYCNLSSTTSVDSKNKTHKTQYTYVVDHTEIPFPAMIEKNIISPIVSADEYVDSKKVGGKLIDYYSTTYYHLPYKEHVMDTNGNYYTSMVYNAYNKGGNLTEFYKPDNIKTTVLYAYNFTLPVAKISDCTIDMVKARLGSNFIEQLGNAYDDYAIFNMLNSIRTAFSDKLISTNKYNNIHRKISQNEDETGLITHYTYDDFGRLKTVRDAANNILQGYDYYLKNATTEPVCENYVSNSAPVDYDRAIPDRIQVCKVTDENGIELSNLEWLHPGDKVRIYWKSTYSENNGYILYISQYNDYSKYMVPYISTFTKCNYVEFTMTCEILSLLTDVTSTHQFCFLIKNTLMGENIFDDSTFNFRINEADCYH